MAVDTKPNFSCTRFEQCTTDVMNLSGCTQIFGIFDMESGSTFTICDNVGDGKVLTSNASGVATWQLAGVDGVTSIGAGSGMNFTTITATGDVTLGTPSTITSGSSNVSSGTTHNHCHDSNTFVTGNQGILVDGNNRFYLDDTYVTSVTLADLYTYNNVTSNQSIGTLNSGDTLGMVYIFNSGSSTAYVNLGTTATGDDITPYQTIQVDASDEVSVTVNMRLSDSENKLMYISSDDWTNVDLRVQWANVTYQNASSSIDPSDLPIATKSTLGAIIVGSGLDIDGAGILSTTGETGGGTITGGTNGLGTSGENVVLGGDLTGTTHIDLNTNIIRIMDAGLSNGLSICPTQVYASLQDGDKTVSLEPTCVDLYSATGAEYSAISLKDNGNLAFDFTGVGGITDSSGDGYGLQYCAAYKNSFTCHSLVDVDYVTGLTSGTTGSGGFLGLVTETTAEPTDLADNQWVKPQPTAGNEFCYVFTNFLGSGGTAISVNLGLEDNYLRYCSTGASAGYWINESYEKPLLSGHTWVGDADCKATELAVVDEWVTSASLLCYTGQKYSYSTQTLFMVDVGCCVTIPNKILIEEIDMDTVANTCIFSIPAGKTAMIDSAKLIMLCDANPTSFSVSIGNNACSEVPASSYCNMIGTHTIDDVNLCEVYNILPVQGGAAICNGSCCGADVYFRVQSASTCGNNLCANLLVEGFIF